MGREIRRVPAEWEHPKRRTGQYQPMYEQNYQEALNEWIRGYELWQKGQHPAQLEADFDASEYPTFNDYEGNPPEIEYYAPYTENEATWYQVYETVSEGTPVTPPFATQEELIDYLVENGDFWYQSDQAQGRETFRKKPTRAQAEGLVGGGSAPSLVAVRNENGVKLMDAYEQQDK